MFIGTWKGNIQNFTITFIFSCVIKKSGQYKSKIMANVHESLSALLGLKSAPFSQLFRVDAFDKSNALALRSPAK